MEGVKKMERISIQEYKRNYFNNITPLPGEHHFVAVYLLPYFTKIPDYVNPDGTKNFCGDIGFNRSSKLFSLEVKLGKKSFKFSKNENNNWFVKKSELKPDYLIALTSNYLFIIEWDTFSKIFIKRNKPEMITDNHKNSKSISETALVEELKKENKNKCIFCLSEKNIEEKIKIRFDELNEALKEKS